MSKFEDFIKISPEEILRPVQLVEILGEAVTVGPVLSQERRVELRGPGCLTDQT